METATLINLSPLEFWELTPFEFRLMIKAYNARSEQEAQEKITLAYVNANWTAQWFGKQKPPSLEKILNGNKPKEPMTAEQMLVMVKQLNAAFGGEVIDN